MKVINLGTCCRDCFNAIHFSPTNLEADEMMRAAEAGKALSLLADREDVKSLHTGDNVGFSHDRCLACGNTLAGDRYEIYGLQDRKDVA